jgi:hypothetical protein
VASATFDVQQSQIIEETPVDAPCGSTVERVCDVTPSIWLSHLEGRIPDEMDGGTFLTEHGGHCDSATEVDCATR